MRQPDNQSNSNGLGDRLVCGVMSGIFAALTLVVYFFLSHAWGFRYWRYETLRSLFNSTACMTIIGTAMVLGFLLGADRITRIFSVFWGTGDR